jgi:predicted transcriptional regulator
MDSTIISLVSRLNQQDKERWEHIAATAEVPLATLIKVARGYTKNPRIDTVDRLIGALDKIEARPQ